MNPRKNVKTQGFFPQFHTRFLLSHSLKGTAVTEEVYTVPSQSVTKKYFLLNL